MPFSISTICKFNNFKKKTIELRKWNTNYRGVFLIHAPIKIRKEDCRRLKINENFTTGAIVGKVEIYDVKKYDSQKKVKIDQKTFCIKKFS